MRAVALLAAALLLSGCTWVRQELAPPQAPVVPAAPTQAAPAIPARPEPVRPPKPRPHPEKPAAQPQAAIPIQAPAPAAAPAPPVDYQGRCRAMAANRADDARELGASPADQLKVQTDTFHDCMQQSVK